MKRILFSIFLLTVLSLPNLFAQWQVSGGLYPVYTHIPATSTGLDAVYILFGMNHSSVSFQSTESSPMRCFRYSASAVFPEQVDAVQEGNRITVSDPQPGYGYFVEQNNRNLSYIWLIDYQPLMLKIKSLAIDAETSDCDFTRLIFDRESPAIRFFTINGGVEELQRKFTLSWQTLKWNDEQKEYLPEDKSEEITGNRELSVEASLCNASYTLSGDQFLTFWNIPVSVTSPEYVAIAVAGQAFAEQHIREAGNELDKNTGELGGSAPVDISFTGYANYPVTTYQAWEISRDKEFEVLEATYPDQNLDYSFESEGTTYVRFIVSNAHGTCEKVVQTFTINTSESSLEVPNVFTPGSETGNNLIFKVAYKSIVKFEGWVFNRWGNQLFHWTNPADGWDGTFNGKIVPTGAYYYVIDAEGVGGKKYKLKGDINVLRTRN